MTRDLRALAVAACFLLAALSRRARLAAPALAGQALTWLALPARLVTPHQGRHRDRLPMTPAPEDGRMQAPRPADPPVGAGAVRAAATNDPGAVNADGGTRPKAPAVPPPSQPEEAACPPARPVLPAPAPAPDSPGRGEHPFSQPVYWHRPDGSVTVIGYGPVAQITAPYAQARVTGAHAIIPGSAPVVPRWYQAYERDRDAAVSAP